MFSYNFRTLCAACCVANASHSQYTCTGTPGAHCVDRSALCFAAKRHNMPAIINFSSITSPSTPAPLSPVSFRLETGQKLSTKVVCIKSIKKFIALLTARLLMASGGHSLRHAPPLLSHSPPVLFLQHISQIWLTTTMAAVGIHLRLRHKSCRCW